MGIKETAEQSGKVGRDFYNRNFEMTHDAGQIACATFRNE